MTLLISGLIVWSLVNSINDIRRRAGTRPEGRWILVSSCLSLVGCVVMLWNESRFDVEHASSNTPAEARQVMAAAHQRVVGGLIACAFAVAGFAVFWLKIRRDRLAGPSIG